MIQAVTFSSPIVGGHVFTPWFRVTWTHHPKKVTTWITRYMYIYIFFPLAVLLAALNFFPQLQKVAQAFVQGSWEYKDWCQKIQGHFTGFVLGYTNLVFQETSTSKVISYNLTPYKWPKLHVFFWGGFYKVITLLVIGVIYNPTYNIIQDAWGDIDMGPYKWPFQWVTGVIKL